MKRSVGGEEGGREGKGRISKLGRFTKGREREEVKESVKG